MRLRRYLEEKFMTEKIESPVVGVLIGFQFRLGSHGQCRGNAEKFQCTL